MNSPMIPVEAAWWVALVIAGYAALLVFVPQNQGLGWALAAFSVLVLASGGWLIKELRKGVR